MWQRAGQFVCVCMVYICLSVCAHACTVAHRMFRLLSIVIELRGTTGEYIISADQFYCRHGELPMLVACTQCLCVMILLSFHCRVALILNISYCFASSKTLSSLLFTYHLVGCTCQNMDVVPRQYGLEREQVREELAQTNAVGRVVCALRDDRRSRGS